MALSRWIPLACLVAAGCGSDVETTAAPGGLPPGFAPCGPEVCTDAEYCCDSDCGRCAPQGVACPDSPCD